MINKITNQGFFSTKDSSSTGSLVITCPTTFSGAILFPSGTTITGSNLYPFNTVLTVGNSLNGDTAANCQYLDNGTCNGIYTASLVAIANPSKKYIMNLAPGTYTFNSTISKITVPSNLSIIGSGVDKTILSSSAASGVKQCMFTFISGSSLTDATLVKPPVTGTVVPGDQYSIVEVGSYTTFKRVNGYSYYTNAVAAQDVFFFGHYNSNLPVGMYFEDCNVYFSGATTANAPNGAIGFGATTTGNCSDPVNPPKFVRCSSTSDGAGNVTGNGFWVHPSSILIDCNSTKMGADAISTNATVSGTIPGPTVINFTADNRGYSTSRSSISAFWGAYSGTGEISGFQINGLRLLGDSNFGNSNNFLFGIGAFSNTVTCSNINLNGLQNLCTVAGAGGIKIDSNNNIFRNINISGKTGDILFAKASTGTTTNVSFVGVDARNVTMISGNVNFRFAGCNIATASIASGADQIRIPSSSNYILSTSNAGTNVFT